MNTSSKRDDCVYAPYGVEFTRTAMEDVGRAGAKRDAPFGDYRQEKRQAG